MDKNPLIFIVHILDCISNIKNYTLDFTEEDFLRNKMVQDAVIRNFEIIGEATKQIQVEFRAKYPNIEWKRIAGLRGKLIHDYIGVDLWAVWAVIEDLLPELEDNINSIIRLES
ncbi:MAG: DUF86 domain-containing protein [Bacteroidota bacterium]